MIPAWAKKELQRIARLEAQAAKAKRRLIQNDPPRWCHPVQAKRTKCACGRTVTLGRMGRDARCECGRLHVKEPGGAFRSLSASYGTQSRPGGRNGCPGVGESQ